jgi:ABC-type dipeptide/oligopeptide/nickel transport system permease subunit
MLLLAFVGVAVFAPLLATHDPDLNEYRARIKPPSAAHWFGTDNFGRDIYSRVVYGARISIYVGVFSTLLETALGALAGLVSGFWGGRIDQLIQRGADVMFTIPGLVLAMVIVTMLGSSMLNVIIAIAIPRLPNANRVIRAIVLSVKESPYVEAARAIGCTSQRIMLRHLVPNIMASYIVVATASLGGAILVEASLSFLGLGVPPRHLLGGVCCRLRACASLKPPRGWRFFLVSSSVGRSSVPTCSVMPCEIYWTPNCVDARPGAAWAYLPLERQPILRVVWSVAGALQALTVRRML